MPVLVDALVLLVVITNLRLLGSSRLFACIRAAAAQAILLSVLPLLASPDGATLGVIGQATASAVIKGFLLPWLLMRAVRGVNVKRELEPIVGYTASLVIGVTMLGIALWLGHRLQVPGGSASSLLVPAALFTVMVGLFLIVARRKAATQVVGYLVMENGIYAFGLAFAQKEPMLVFFGILLDVFVAVFVMGITLFHINREFHSIDTDRLSELKD